MRKVVSAVLLGVCIAALNPSVARSQTQVGANAVVAFVDTGINPYHEVFRDTSPRAYEHPSTYIDGYPEDAEALHLTFSAPDYQTAFEKDAERIWERVQPRRLYWFPGTRIVGAIGVSCVSGASNCVEPTPILDFHGHGTMVSSRGAGTGYGACPDCLIVSVQGFSESSTAWPAANADWIDAQSNSWGPIVPLWGPQDIGLTMSDPSFVRTVEAAARSHLAFWASGNGIATRLGVLGHPTVVDPAKTPSVVIVGGHDSGYVNTWPSFPPHVVSDSCNSWAAVEGSMDRSGDSVGGGTSGAAPFVAGRAARVLLEARRLVGDTGTGVTDGVVAAGSAVPGSEVLDDGVLTMQEWKRLLFTTATERPVRQYEDGSDCTLGGGGVLYDSTPVRWTDVPEAYPEFVHIGYGAVDDPALARAEAVLRGESPQPDRTDTDAYFVADHAAREHLHRAWTLSP